MISLQSLRNAHALTRLVLVWLALFIGAAVASPLLKSPAVETVCSGGGGMKMVVLEMDKSARLAAHASLDCPACLPWMAPPLAVMPASRPPQGGSHELWPQPFARPSRLPGQPGQARAPPEPLI